MELTQAGLGTDTAQLGSPGGPARACLLATYPRSAKASGLASVLGDLRMLTIRLLPRGHKEAPVTCPGNLGHAHPIPGTPPRLSHTCPSPAPPLARTCCSCCWLTALRLLPSCMLSHCAIFCRLFSSSSCGPSPGRRSEPEPGPNPLPQSAHLTGEPRPFAKATAPSAQPGTKPLPPPNPVPFTGQTRTYSGHRAGGRQSALLTHRGT